MRFEHLEGVGNTIPLYYSLLMLSLFFACAQHESATWERAPSRDWAVFEDVQPKWDRPDILAAFQDMLSFGLPHGDHFWFLYKELYDEGATPTCPGTNYNFNGVELTGYDCWTSEGFQFEGFSEYEYWPDGYRIHLEGRIVAPDGRNVYGAGSVRVEEYPASGSQNAIYQRFEGSFYSNFGDSWLAQLPSTYFQMERFHNGARFDGGYTINGNAFFYRNLDFTQCPEGKGQIWIRDPSGGWWIYVPSDDCDGSGDLYFNATNTGVFEWDLKQLSEMVMTQEGTQ